MVLARYSRQTLYTAIGEDGQRRLSAARVLLIGCGALGTHIADTLVRAGVGFLRIVDRDYIELNNLQRQVLFDEDDIAAGLPKAEAARRKMTRINSAVHIEAMVTDANYRNVESLAEGAGLILDGTDNFETRYLINDLAIKTQRPWIYGACVGATGLCLPVLPGETPCLRCVFEQAPPSELNPTCDTAGILGPAVNIVAAHQAMEALKLLSGHAEAVDRRLLRFDLWDNRYVHLDVTAARTGTCPCCDRGEFDFLSGKLAGGTTVLCGRNAIQLTPGDSAGRAAMDFAVIADKLRSAGARDICHNPFMLKAGVENVELTLFPDGRVIVTGTKNPDQARTIVARYVGT